MIDLEQISTGVIISVRALPGSRRNEVRGEQAGALKVSVTKIPEKGKANKAVQEQLAKELGLRKAQVQLISGELSQQKKFLITDITIEKLTTILMPLIECNE